MPELSRATKDIDETKLIEFLPSRDLKKRNGVRFHGSNKTSAIGLMNQ